GPADTPAGHRERALRKARAQPVLRDEWARDVDFRARAGVDVERRRQAADRDFVVMDESRRRMALARAAFDRPADGLEAHVLDDARRQQRVPAGVDDEG